MRTRRVLILDAAGVTAFRCCRKQVSQEAVFAADERDAFDRYIADRTRDACFLIVDLPDEKYTTDELPHVRGPGRTALVARVRERHCHGTPYSLALPLGRRSDGRRDDRYLFAALPHAEAIDSWLQRLDKAGVPLAGVYSLPQLVAELPCAAASGPLLVTNLGRSNLRQTFVLDGKLRFSRLTPVSDSFAAGCAAEAANMRRYLCAQRLMERDAVLPVRVLAPAAQQDDFRRHCVDTDELRFDYVDLDVETAGRRVAGAHPCGTLLARLLADRPPSQQFAPPAARRRWQLHRIADALDVAGVAGMAAGLLFAAAQLPDLVDKSEAALRLQAQNQAESLHRAVRAEADAIAPHDLVTLGRGVETLERVSPGPVPVLRVVGAALDDAVAIEIERLEWRISADFEGKPGPFAVIDIHGRLTDSAARHDFDRFAGQLRRSLHVRVAKPPFALESGRPLRSDDAATDDGSLAVRVGQPL